MSDALNEQQQQSQASADVLYNEQKPVAETPTEAPNTESATPNGEAPSTEQAPAKAEDTTQKNDKPEDKGDQTKDKATPPEKYDLKLPADSPVDPTRLEKIAAEAKAQGLSQEQAQALVEREHIVVNDLVETHKARVKQWAEEAVADKEIGGPDINRNIELAKRVVDAYGSPILKQHLEDTGYGQHPELIRLFVRLGKASGEDRLVLGGNKNTPVPKSAADLLFGDGTEEKQT